MDSAHQRAENLAILGAKKVLELCVGPSLQSLEHAYSAHGIEVTGNDIDSRWKDYYPNGNWEICDYSKVDHTKYDAIVFAPPLSENCSGKREDSLSIDEVNPKYTEFMDHVKNYDGVKVMVLPAKSVITRYDRTQLFKLLNKIPKYDLETLTCGRRKIIKYVDIYY